MRLQAVLPRHTVLAHVSFDALLTTKFAHTRRKYQGLVADFVVLDQQHQVLAMIEIPQQRILCQSACNKNNYQDSLLETSWISRIALQCDSNWAAVTGRPDSWPGLRLLYQEPLQGSDHATGGARDKIQRSGSENVLIGAHCFNGHFHQNIRRIEFWIPHR